MHEIIGLRELFQTLAPPVAPVRARSPPLLYHSLSLSAAGARPSPSALAPRHPVRRPLAIPLHSNRYRLLFLAWRIRQLSHSLWLFAIIAVFSFGQGALGCAGAIGALQTPNINQFTHLIPVVDSWLAIAVLTDGMITILLSRYLWLSRTGRSRTDRVIWRIIRSAVETAAFSSVFCIMDLVCFTVLQSTNFHLIFALPMGRLYSATLMTTLNNRVSLRHQFDQNSASETSFNVAFTSSNAHRDQFASNNPQTDQFASNNAHPMKMYLKFKSLQSPETIATQDADVENDIGDGEHGGDRSDKLKVVPVV
ncbi:hypothetical protein EWM64_g4878 [Hericium alpestre]|uniref:DUF6534 domain-containing protein n=1 Tax=Hericium alpestre TaxID=135208 RepID=A0A4Y9ZYH4_9AGAM|nr:hypothetical protein EWM64_g4878 [Hericium alpestre]